MRKYKPFFDAVPKLVSLHNRVTQALIHGQTAEVVRSLIRLMSNDYGSVLLLLLNGYGPQAMKIVRSMFEAECNIHYLKDNPDAVRDYIEFNVIERKKIYDLMEDEQKSKPEVAGLLADYNAIVPRFTKNGKLRRDWCEKTLYQRAEAAGLKDLYVTIYRWMSSVHHADFSSIVYSHDPSADDVHMAPSFEWLDDALIGAHGSFLRALPHYSEIIGVSIESEMQELVREHQATCKRIPAPNS